MQGCRGLIATCAAIAAALLALAAPAETVAAEPEPQARAWVLLDADDREVLAARDPEREASVASTTKLMTAYVARRELDLDEVVVAPAYDGAAVESLLGLRDGERIRVRDLLAGLLLESGNDAAVALATAAAGSVSAFVDEMNRAARRLGLEGTSFANPIGLDEAGNHSTPRDLASLAIELRRDRFLRRLIASPEVKLESGAPRPPVSNRNRLVGPVPWVNGVKTGYTLEAGHVLVSSGTRKGVTLVSVVLGAPSEDARDAGTLALLRYGFSLYRREAVVERSRELAAAGIRFREETLPLVAARTLTLTLRRGEEVATRVVAPDEVEGPVERGERLGRVVVSVGDEPVGRVPLRAGRGIAAATSLERLDAAVPGPRSVIWAAGLSGLALVVGGILAVVDRRRRRWGDSLFGGEESP